MLNDNLHFRAQKGALGLKSFIGLHRVHWVQKRLNGNHLTSNKTFSKVKGLNTKSPGVTGSERALLAQRHHLAQIG